MVAQSRDRETDLGQSRDGPNRENAHNNNTIELLTGSLEIQDVLYKKKSTPRLNKTIIIMPTPTINSFHPMFTNKYQSSPNYEKIAQSKAKDWAQPRTQ